MELSDSVIIPREDFADLQYQAFQSPNQTAKDHIVNTVQFFVYCAILAAVVPVATWGWTKAMDKKDAKDSARRMREAENEYRILHSK